ncbi:MAG: TolC family protein, partial [Spirochaetota bacterium]|nr:TolC family protein [Spirochaetota bacterium]
LEESKLFPQIDVFVRYKKEMKEQMYDIGVAFPLPIFNTNSNNVEAREKEKESIQIEIQAVTETVKRDILVALRKIRLALSKINRFERSILKDSERSKLLIKEFYSMGGTEFITLLEQEKVYQEMILSYWSAVQEYYFAFFLLEKAIGRVIFYSNRNEWESINFKTIYNKNYK